MRGFTPPFFGMEVTARTMATAFLLRSAAPKASSAACARGQSSSPHTDRTSPRLARATAARGTQHSTSRVGWSGAVRLMALRSASATGSTDEPYL